MRTLTLAVLLVAGVALADIPPSNSTQCHSAQTGAACTTDDGKPGTCLKQLVSRLDYSEGVPPKTKQVEMLLCVASVTARSTATSSPPFFAAGALMLVMLGLIVTKLVSRGRRSAAA
ncbi:MAG: hypothetical protein GQE15_18545 [Archangiaceae bacterium]|nr:hypothetical protein [Archangiaceae bacterium]